jgi:hypothetical protein
MEDRVRRFFLKFPSSIGWNRRERIRAPGKKNFRALHKGRTGLKILTLNRKDRLSVAELPVLGPKKVIFVQSQIMILP